MKKLASVFRFSAGFLAVLVLVGLFGRMPVQANAWTVQRDDGTWLWPLPTSALNSITDWAGCTGSNYYCIFCDTNVIHTCGAASHTGPRGHAGIDVGVYRQPVYAMAPGKVVVYDGSVTARGNTLVMEHYYTEGWSYYSYYEHLESATVSVSNTELPAGTQIAISGNSGKDGSGNPYEYHLHYGIVFGPANSIHSAADIKTFEDGPGIWMWQNTYEMGRIIVNPATTNTLPIGDLNSGNLSRHPGSVNYTSDPSKVKIGMSGTSGTVVSVNSPWYYSATPQNILWQNMANDEVKWLQQALNVTMNAGLTVDGSFGPTTREVLIAYQVKHGIGSDGLFGPESNAHMVNQLKILGYLSDGTYHEHAYTKYVSNGDDTHTAKCKVCEYADEEHTGIACSGGTATNTTPAMCQYCGETYGDILPEEKDVVTLNGKEIKDWKVGQEGQFKVYVNGVRVDRDTMIWSSSNPTVATCVNGYLVGKSAGTTVISCTKENGTTAICKVTVVAADDVVTLNAKEIKNWEVGQAGAFKVYVNGVQVDRTTMTWSSSNTAVATCVNGKLVGKSVGTTTISCTKENGTTATCKVTVISGKDVVTLNSSEIKNWEVGQSGPFKVYVNGVQVDRTTMTWNSSNPSVATCVNGKLVGKSVGTTTITCTKTNGTTASCKVTVVSGKDVVTLNTSEIKNWEVGQSGPFKVYVNGVQVDRTTMTWNSSNPSVATCVNGKLVGKSVGTTTITCTKTNGTTASCKVTVVSGKDVVTLNSTEIKNWEVGQSGPFKVYVNGVQVDRTTMTWNSSNPAVATCVNGKLVGKSAGTTTITCTKTNGTTASCKVTVVKGKDVVTLNAVEIKNWEVGQSGTFKVYVNGVQTDRTTMIWSSSNEVVATCVNGRLVGKSAGTATITCTKTNGTVASCTVTVKAATTPTVTPIPTRNLGGMNLIIGDYWSPETPAEPVNATDEAIQKYREELFAKYNFTMQSKAVADWGTMQATYIDSVIMGEPAAQLFELNSSFISPLLTNGLFYDLATLDELDFSEAKWNQAVKRLMTKGNSVYGMQANKSEPGVGLIWNKRLFEEAGIDPNLPYDLQASGQWTWSAFEDLCERLTRDVNNDGVTDIYATSSQGEMTVTAFVVSTGSDFIVQDANGNLVNNLNSDEVIDAINFAVDLYDKGYEMPQPVDSNWDYFVTAFQQGKAAMQFNEEYTCQPPYQYGDEMEDEVGFVMPPKPDGATKNYSYVNNNIVVIPSCYDAETAGDIAFAYNVYTMASAAYEGENYWKNEYYTHFSDTRAVDETIAKFMDGTSAKMLTSDLTPIYLGENLLWYYPFLYETPEERIASITDSWDAILAEINQSY